MNLTRLLTEKKGKKLQLLEQVIVKVRLFENNKMAKQFLTTGKLTEKDYDWLISIDSSPTKKYVGWLAKVLVNERPDRDDLRNAIEEFHTFLGKGKTKTKDIFQFKSFNDLTNELSSINESGDSLSLKELEDDYETIVDNTDLLVCTPHTHEASRKLGLTKFAFRDCPEGKDAAWCTTYKAPDHFVDYYYGNNVTFYYVLVRGEELIKKIKEAFPKKAGAMCVVALALLQDGQIDAYDGENKQLTANVIEKFRTIVGL